MDPKYLAEIKAREQAATPGTWQEKTNRHPQCNGEPWGWISGAAGNITWSGYVGKKNADFIANARTDIPALIAEVERQEYIISGIMHSVDKWFDVVPDKDEVSRAIDAREIALKEIERLSAEVERLQAERDAAVALHKDCARELNAAHKNHTDDFMRLNAEISTLKSASESQLQTMNALTGKMATLKKALELACKDIAKIDGFKESKSNAKVKKIYCDGYIKQAQEQEEKK